VTTCDSAPDQYRASVLADVPSATGLRATGDDDRAILRSVMAHLVDRFDRTPGYVWVDTKQSILTGEDFRADDPVRGRGTVYGWIQGRALESLAGHARWFSEHDQDAASLVPHMQIIARSVLDALRQVRAKNSGHSFFFLTESGDPRVLAADGMLVPANLTADSPANFSDLFSAKGMYAAAQLLGDPVALAEARAYCRSVAAALFSGRFASDQQALDPKNPVTPVPGRISHGPFMIAIGMARVLVELGREREWVATGIRLIDHVLTRHVNTCRRWPALGECDFVEFIDPDGHPWESDGRVFCDPGHSLEFVGLTLAFARCVLESGIATPVEKDRIHEIQRAMPAVFERAFALGFRERGVCKLVDLRTGEPVNADMPWWSLPETMRAALGLAEVAPDDTARRLAMRAFARCHNAFVVHYVRPDRHLQAVQTLAADGKPSDAIPATPDADPGYHTGLSLIDCLRMLGAT
jgi:mannose/cellobiose epimerase-like protein (N-acyl-D-glucosamine 2-epimerase family)